MKVSEKKLKIKRERERAGGKTNDRARHCRKLIYDQIERVTNMRPLLGFSRVLWISPRFNWIETALSAFFTLLLSFSGRRRDKSRVMVAPREVING